MYRQRLPHRGSNLDSIWPGFKIHIARIMLNMFRLHNSSAAGPGITTGSNERELIERYFLLESAMNNPVRTLSEAIPDREVTRLSASMTYSRVNV